MIHSQNEIVIWITKHSVERNVMLTSQLSVSPAPISQTFADLVLSASCRETARAASFLVGAIRACGGTVVSRSFDADGGAELELEFERGVCLDIYCLMVAIGAELDAASHLQITAFCQCTRECFARVAQDTARAILRLREPQLFSAIDEDDPGLLRGIAPNIYEA